jgi:hypothetical protein
VSDILAFFSSVFFTVATFPVAWGCFKTGKVDLPWSFMGFIMCAHLCGAGAVLLSWHNLPLLLDFAPGALIYAVLLIMKRRETKKARGAK